IPAHRSGKSPYELFRGRTIPLDFFHPIGNPVSFLNEPKNPGTKIYPKGSLGRLIGYNEELLSYRILAEDGRIVDTKSVQFLEFKPAEKSNALDDDDDFEIIIEKIVPSQNCVQNEKELIKAPQEEYPGIKQEFESNDGGLPEKEIDISCDSDNDEEIKEILSPAPPTQAINSEEKDKWIKAADDELKSIEGHEVWEDMWETPPSHLHVTWVFRTKPATLSAAKKKKARLCIQGFLQLPGVDYDETFVPTGKFSTLLILLTLAVEKQLPLRQFDVKAAFLYAPLK
ncbi:hypothetical protein VP01_8559g1, partial [Puccinia sorghi]